MRTQSLPPSIPENRPKGTAEKGRPVPKVQALRDVTAETALGHHAPLTEVWAALDRELSDLAFQIDSRGQGGLTLRLARLRNRMTELVGRP